jgi:hypothetical protein
MIVVYLALVEVVKRWFYGHFTVRRAWTSSSPRL